jgi:dTDP-glucose pyrophosphorylase/CBS domain-containing protein
MRPITDPRIVALLLTPDATIRDAMRRIDSGGAEIALMVDATGRLLGTVSDGDVRRALLGGAGMDDLVEPFTTGDPATVPESADRAAALDLMRARTVSQIPEVDAQGHLTGLHLLHDVIGVPPRPNWALIMAGGRGTRLGPLTSERPKPMLEVAGRPILERIVLHLVGAGIRHIALSIGYLGEQIEEHFGDGAAFGCEIVYLRESVDRPLGTGGPLRLLEDHVGTPDDPVLVMNGDLVTSFSVGRLLRAHASLDARVTLGLRDYVHEVPFGVVRFEDEAAGTVASLEEKPSASWTVNAGIYVVDPDLLSEVPRERHYPITDLLEHCLGRGDTVGGWRIDGDWHDVGRPAELRQARGQS